MSDDDDRMDRARRIRQMREGRRGGEDEPTDVGESESTDGSDEADSKTTATPEETSTGGPEETGTETATATGTASTQAAAQSATETAQPGPVGSPDGSDTGTAEEPQADDESEWFDGQDGTREGSSGEPADGGDTESATQSSADTAGQNGADEGDTADESSAEASAEGQSAAAKAAQAAAEFETIEETSEPEMTLEQLEADAAADERTEPSAEGEPTAETGDAAAESESTEDESEEPAESGTGEEIRVLEFELGGERYCLNIMYVEEIVKKDHITRVPNTPEFVRGVVDLRGQITTILDPKESIGIEDGGTEELIVVFDGETFEDQGHIGWLVDEVRQVTPITPSEVKESPTDRTHINGIIERDEEFVIWTTPEIALAKAEAESEE